MLLKTPKNKYMTIQEIADMALKQVLDDTTADGVTIREWLEKISSGEYQPVKHGRWVKSTPSFTKECSVCHNEPIAEWDDYGGEYALTNYCPFCGAKMDGGVK